MGRNDVNSPTLSRRGQQDWQEERLEAGARAVAPGELELVREFLNTLDVEDAVEEIGSPESLAAWLAEHGLENGRELDDEDVRRAIAMREGLRALTLANNGAPLSGEAVSRLNSIADDAQLRIRFDEHGRPSLDPAGTGSERALGELLAIVFRSMADGTWPRLKACRADTCQWVFYDRSKNRSGTWCSMAVCGNRAKARSYRERHRHDG
jgi:predicted RNA-binding Zn ribbon-like protein